MPVASIALPQSRRHRDMGLDEQVRALEALDLEGLRAQWRLRYGAPPKLRSVDLLARLLAWRIQADQLGELSPDTRKQLRAAATPKPADVRVRPGARLVREWRGRRCEVAVEANGFVYEGRRYRSLSAIAREITGTRWNGPKFFGLKCGEGAP